MKKLLVSLFIFAALGCGPSEQNGASTVSSEGDQSWMVEMTYEKKWPLEQEPLEMDDDIELFLTPSDERPRQKYFTEPSNHYYYFNVTYAPHNEARPDRWPDDMTLHRLLIFFKFSALFIGDVYSREDQPEDAERARQMTVHLREVAEIFWDLNLYFKSSVINIHEPYNSSVFKPVQTVCTGGCGVYTKGSILLKRSLEQREILEANLRNSLFDPLVGPKSKDYVGGDSRYWRDAYSFDESDSGDRVVTDTGSLEGNIRVPARRFDGADFEVMKRYELEHSEPALEKTFFTFDHFYFTDDHNNEPIYNIISHIYLADEAQKLIIKRLLRAYTAWLWAANRQSGEARAWFGGHGIQRMFGRLFATTYGGDRQRFRPEGGGGLSSNVTVHETEDTESTHTCKQKKELGADSPYYTDAENKFLTRAYQSAVLYLERCSAEPQDGKCAFGPVDATLYRIAEDEEARAYLSNHPCLWLTTEPKAKAAHFIDKEGNGSAWTGDGITLEGAFFYQVDYAPENLIEPAKRDYYHRYHERTEWLDSL